MKVRPKNQQDLCDAVMTTWTRISKACFQNLVNSMPQTIKAVWRAKAGATQYKYTDSNKVFGATVSGIDVYVFAVALGKLHMAPWK